MALNSRRRKPRTIKRLNNYEVYYYYARKNLDVEINDNCNANESAIFQYNGKFWIVLNIRCKKKSVCLTSRFESYTILDYTGVSSFYLVEDLIT